MSKQRDEIQKTAGPSPGGWLNLAAFAVGAAIVVAVIALAMIGAPPVVHAQESQDIRCLADTNKNKTIERDEAINVVAAYLLARNIDGLGRPPTRPETVTVVTAYLLQITIDCAPTPTPTPSPTATRFPTTTPSPTPTPMPLRRLAFVSDRDGNLNIYTMNSDGSNQTRLTANTGDDNYPSWAADGLGIVYAVRESGTWNIHGMDDDGANDVRLTSDEITDQGPDWSPDGAKIVFSRNGDLFTMNADGSGQINLNEKGHSPNWSPDGSRIAYHQLGFSGTAELYVMNADGSNIVRLTDNAVGDAEPSWSPDGRRIAFNSTRGGSSAWNIHVMDADGSNVVNLTKSGDNNYGPSWSPDGQSIAFWSQRDGNDEIYVMNADGSNVTRITRNAASDRAPYWERGPASPVVTEVDLNGSGSAVTVDTGGLIDGSLKYQAWSDTEPGAQIQLIAYLARDDGKVSANHALEYACLFTGIPGAHPGVQGTAKFVLTAPSEAGSYTLRVSQTSSADCPTAAASITEPGREAGSVTVSGPPRFTAFVDFSGPIIRGQNFALIVGPFVQYNTSQGSPDGDSWRMLVPGLSYIQVSVNLASVAQGASLTMIHLSSGAAGVQGGGYSPVDIIINGALFQDNFDVAENHDFSHSMEVDSWQIASLLKPGNNTIRVEFEDDPTALTQYWIKEIMLKN